MENSERIRYLIQQSDSNNATPEELSELLGLLDRDDQQVVISLVDEWITPRLVQTGEEETDIREWRMMARQILLADKSVIRKRRLTFIRYWWAAAAALLLVAGLLFLYSRQNRPVPIEMTQHAIAPGGDKATLTLANGKQIILDQADNGALVKQGDVQVLKLDSGVISYAGGSAGEVYYNTISTPKGGKFQVILPDKSEVWLNASSSLRFPTAFVGKERRVELTGEGYFEIAANSQQPFFVQCKQMTVQALGTSFNINAYEDEGQINATLTDGAVKVTASGAALILKPGEQAVLHPVEEALQLRRHIDVAAVIAWKNGLFYFSGADIQTIMRQLSRWYNITVRYEGQIPVTRFNGKIERNVALSEVLKILTISNINFKINGNEITVMP